MQLSDNMHKSISKVQVRCSGNTGLHTDKSGTEAADSHFFW
jgi:hypothetical protein